MDFPFRMFDAGFGLWFLIAIVVNAAFWIGLVAVIILGIRWLIRRDEVNRSTRPGEDTAMELLRQRFARGEIDAAEFEERKRALGG
jgi:putative membrane protein